MATNSLHPTAQRILDYWFSPGWEHQPPLWLPEERQKLWFGGGADIDQEITKLFKDDTEVLLAGGYDDWQHSSPYQALAGIILGDQLCRNIYRNTPTMYAADSKAFAWAKDFIQRGDDVHLKPIFRFWLGLPLMHSERLEDQEECLECILTLLTEVKELSKEEGAAEGALLKLLESSIDYAKAHKAVIEKWGRFPHRNAILGRQSTPEEIEGLEKGTIPAW